MGLLVNSLPRTYSGEYLRGVPFWFLFFLGMYVFMLMLMLMLVLMPDRRMFPHQKKTSPSKARRARERKRERNVIQNELLQNCFRSIT